MKLNDDIKFLILLIAVILSMACMFFQPKYPVAYDCRIAEFSPDVPPAVKEQCRKRMEKH
jgi:hypothetical protein